jgi:hypothetical protein
MGSQLRIRKPMMAPPKPLLLPVRTTTGWAVRDPMRYTGCNQ